MTSTILPVKINKGIGQPIVLLHGLGNNYKSWTYVLEAIDYSALHILAIDLLGFGDAPKPSNTHYSPDDHAEAVINTLDSLNISNAIIAGHSMGCIVAIAVAKKRPDLAGRLVLLGAPLYERIPRGDFWSKLLKREGAYFTLFSFIAKNPDATITTMKAADTLIPLLKGMEVTDETWPAYKASLQQTIMQIQSYRDLINLKTPTLLVYGKLDIFIIKQTLRRAVRKNRRLVRLETTLGPHEITPLEGKKIAKTLQKESDLLNSPL